MDGEYEDQLLLLSALGWATFRTEANERSRMNPDEYFRRIFDPAVEFYTEVVHRVEARFPMPELVDVNGSPQWRYPEMTVEHMCLLRCVRIVSAFNAIRGMLVAGYVQEIPVLLRTIDEFQEDIVFLIEGYPAEELGNQQQKFMLEMGKEEYCAPDSPFATKVARNPPTRKKIKSAVARSLSPVVNPSDSKEASHVATDCLSGYVHGAYPHIMELYGGPPPHSRFHMTGMLGTPRMRTCASTVAMYLQRTGPVLGFMCRAFGMEEDCQNLYHMKNWFVKELQDLLGCDMDLTPEEALRLIKTGQANRGD